MKVCFQYILLNISFHITFITSFIFHQKISTAIIQLSLTQHSIHISLYFYQHILTVASMDLWHFLHIEEHLDNEAHRG